MGAGPCPEEAKVHLLQQVLDLNLGFSKPQLCRAIDHLVKEFGSSEEALAWIPRDNFTILVNYILDNDTDSVECQQLSSPLKCEDTRKVGDHPTPSAQGGRTRTEEQRKGGDHPTKGEIKRLSNGCAVGMSGGIVPLEVDQSAKKMEQRSNSSSSQRCLVDRNELRKHYKRKLSTDIVKVSNQSMNSKVNEAQFLTIQTEHTKLVNSFGPSNSSGHFSSSRIFTGSELVSPKVVPLQRKNSVATCEDQKTRNNRELESGSFVNKSSSFQKYGKIPEPEASIATCGEQKVRKKRDAESASLINKSSSLQKNGKVPEPEATKERVWERRALAPSGCHDLATSPRSPQIKKNKTFIQNQSSVAGQCDRSRADTLTQQSGERKASRVSLDLDKTKEAPSTPRGLKSMDRDNNTRGAETCKAILLSNNDGQKASCSVINGNPVKREQDNPFYGADNFLLVHLEAFLKEGNCQRALEVFETWKQKGQQAETWHTEGNHLEGRGHEMVADIPGKKRGLVVSCDISRGLEKIPITCVNEYNTDVLPENFLYITRSVIRQAAHVDSSFGRIGDLHCCCSDDCLRSSEACKCTDSTRGEYGYDRNGRLIERLATCFQSGCVTTDGDFVTECCDKCRCSLNCGNRIVQRGITRKLQVFMTPTKKGWGVRALETIPARAFVFEYIGEIATNLEQFDRNSEYEKNNVHSYTMCLDADLDMERSHFKEGLNDNEALVLDATIFGNVSRFVNHRCNDANLFLRPVQIETRDTHYYHAAMFAARDIQEMEELTWDYGIDFQDKTHALKAFKCHCKSSLCRDKESAFNREKLRKGKNVKAIHSKHKDGQHGRQ